MDIERRDRMQRTRLAVIGVAQIVWGILLLLLATGVALVWFGIVVAIVAVILLERVVYQRVAGRDGAAPSRFEGRWGTVALAMTGVLLVATGTAVIFDGLSR